MKPLFDLVVRKPILFLCLSLLLAAPFMAFMPFVRTVDNVDYFTLENDPDKDFYESFKEVFGNDEFFVIAFETDALFTEKTLTLIREITDKLEALDDVREVTSLSNVNDTIGGPDYFEVRAFLEEIPDTPEGLEKARKEALSNPLYLKNLVSPDGRTAAIVVSAHDRPEDPEYRKRLIAETENILSEHADSGLSFKTAGWTTTNFYLSQYMKKDVATFIPVTYCLVAAALFFFFRNIRLTAAGLINIGITMGSTMGLFAILDITLNNVTSIVPPLVMALALCDTVHIFSHMEKQTLDQYSNKRQAISHIIRQVVVPCFLTTLTTAIGFLSLAVSEIPPIRDFAWIASAGMVFEFIFSFFFLPPMLLFFDPRKIFKDYASDQEGVTRLLDYTGNTVLSRSRPISALGLVVIIVSIGCASLITVETNLIEYFKESSPVRRNLSFVEAHLAGVETLDISLSSDEADAFKDPANLRVLAGLQAFIDTLPGVDKTMSFVDFIKDMNESFHDEDPLYRTIPDSRALISQYLLLYDAEDIEDYVNADYDHARLSARTSRHGTREQAVLIDRVNERIANMDLNGLDVRVTGRILQNVNTIDAIVRGQVYSLGLAALTIGILMIFVLRSVATGLLSLIPNAFPIFLNFGIMGVFGIPLNTATALIAAVALGIAVDDTIHFLTAYLDQKNQGKDAPEAIRAVIFSKGRAILSSSLILTLGFGVLVVSRFVPIIHFGLLSAIIMVTAVFGDLAVLPSMLLLNTTDRPKNSSAGS